jgi:hypothetical protein
MEPFSIGFTLLFPLLKLQPVLKLHGYKISFNIINLFWGSCCFSLQSYSSTPSPSSAALHAHASPFSASGSFPCFSCRPCLPPCASFLHLQTVHKGSIPYFCSLSFQVRRYERSHRQTPVIPTQAFDARSELYQHPPRQNVVNFFHI